jgi:hypothetical protein
LRLYGLILTVSKAHSAVTASRTLLATKHLSMNKE